MKDYTITNAPVHPIGSATIDVPRSGAAVASVKWTAPVVPIESVHWCIIAEIEIYVDSNTSLPELTGMNNLAQSNYSRAFSTTASPWTREVRTLTLHNTEKEGMIIDLVADQTNPLFRSYLQHDWVRLNPGEERTVEIMIEYAGEEYLEEGGDGNVYEEYRSKPNDLVVSGIARFPTVRDFQFPTGGASFRVEEGMEIIFDKTSAHDVGEIVIEGLLAVKRTGATAPNGQILVTLDPGTPNATTLPPVQTNQGYFQAITVSGWTQASVYYIAPQGYGDVEILIDAP